jgi:hypothetical protein
VVLEYAICLWIDEPLVQQRLIVVKPVADLAIVSRWT